MIKKIAFACDHRGFEIKDKILGFLRSKGYETQDCGTYSLESTDYVDPMIRAAELVAQKKCDAAIGVCYTGIGSAIVANKVKGIRAALVHLVKEAELSRAHNDSNMLILGSGFLDQAILLPLIETWLTTPFEGGRHERRVNKIKSYEEQHR